jgi:hypothetical protein
VVCIYTVSGLARDGRTNGGGEHQVLGRSEWIGGGGGIKGACLVHTCNYHKISIGMIYIYIYI